MIKEVFLIASLVLVAVQANDFIRAKSRQFQEPVGPEIYKNRAVQLRTIEQKVDNFNAQNTATYLMRYYENGDYFQPGGPIFIFVGGTWTITPSYVTDGHMFDMARDMGGMMYYPEHRYYGESRPTSDMSTENLQFLSVDQALADLATFIVRQKENPGMENSAVILVGSSSSGSMVTWFRQKYPHLTAGVWASSAPLQANVDFIEFKEMVGAAVRHVGGDECYARIERAFSQMEELVDGGDLEVLREKFYLCNDLDGDLNIWTFFVVLTEDLIETVQFHQNGFIEYTCSIITNPEIIDDIEAYAAYVRMYKGGFCLDADYQELLEYLQYTPWSYSSDSRSWYYQICSEFGWFQTTGSAFQPFGSLFPADFYYNLCEDLFGELFNQSRIDANIARTNVIYGGRNPAITNAIFTHGMFDPWRPMGVQTDLNDRAPAIVLAGASQSKDLSSISVSDSDQMRSLKFKIEQLVRLWIAEWNNGATIF